MNRFRLIKLDRILSAEGELQPLLAKTRDLRVLGGLLAEFLSAELAPQAGVANFKDGELSLVAGTSAAAAKLRLLAPTLVRSLRERRWQVNSVSVRVQPNRSREASTKVQKTVHLSTLALDRLRALHASMAPSPARDAIAKMLRRHGANPGKEKRGGQP